MKRLFALLGLMAICVACQGTCPIPGASPSLPLLSPTAQVTPVPLSKPEDAVARAVSDLARRLGVEPSSVEVLAAVDDELPAQDLGCPSSPQKEQPVRPALVMGKVIRLRAAGLEYEYRAHGGRMAFCGQR